MFCGDRLIVVGASSVGTLTLKSGTVMEKMSVAQSSNEWGTVTEPTGKGRDSSFPTAIFVPEKNAKTRGSNYIRWRSKVAQQPLYPANQASPKQVAKFFFQSMRHLSLSPFPFPLSPLFFFHLPTDHVRDRL
jgi:hypothetical protein